MEGLKWLMGSQQPLIIGSPTTRHIGCITFARLWGFLHFNDLWLLFSTISRRYLDFEQAAHNFSRSWYKICQHYNILKVAQSYTYLSHLLRNWVAQTYYKFFWKKSRKWVIFIKTVSQTCCSQHIKTNNKIIHMFTST